MLGAGRAVSSITYERREDTNGTHAKAAESGACNFH